MPGYLQWEVIFLVLSVCPSVCIYDHFKNNEQCFMTSMFVHPNIIILYYNIIHINACGKAYSNIDLYSVCVI